MCGPAACRPPWSGALRRVRSSTTPPGLLNKHHICSPPLPHTPLQLAPALCLHTLRLALAPRARHAPSLQLAPPRPPLSTPLPPLPPRPLQSSYPGGAPWSCAGGSAISPLRNSLARSSASAVRATRAASMSPSLGDARRTSLARPDGPGLAATPGSGDKAGSPGGGE